MKSHIKNIRIAPKKMNLIAEMIRKKNVNEALALLKFTPKRAAGILYKALYSAVKNAENNEGKKKETLMVEEIYIGKEPTLKRFMPVSRGRAHSIRKRCSQVKISLSTNEGNAKTTEEKTRAKQKNPGREVKKLTPTS